MKGRIVRIVSKNYELLLDNGERAPAILTGKIRLQRTPYTGDIVEAAYLEGIWTIQKIEERRNYLVRPYVANVDRAFIVMSVKEPDFSTALVDRLSFLITHAGIEPFLIVTKCDLGIPDDVEERIREYERGPMKVYRTGEGSLPLEAGELFADKVSVLTGQSGAGKSSLLNRLDPSFHLATQEISKALGRGKHTTRHNELHPVAGGLVADTPGFSSLSFNHMKVTDLAQSVPDFAPYIGKCRFNDCIHQNEPGCAIKDAVEKGIIPEERYRNYLQVLEMIQNRREKYL